MDLKSSKKVFLVCMLVILFSVLLFQASTNESYLPDLQKPSITANITPPESEVAIVQAAVAMADSITYDTLKSMVKKAVVNAGGLNEIIKNGDVVILKPNLVSSFDETDRPRLLPTEANGITTDWRVAKIVVELVREINPDGKVYILEGVANGTTKSNMTNLKYTPEFIPGVDKFIHLEDESGAWREWNSPFLVKVLLPENAGLYPDYKKPNLSAEFYLNKIYYEADVVISMPVLKNHSTSNITGAIKNVGIGTSPTNIYGGVPGDNRRYINNTIDHLPKMLHRWIHDYYLCRPIDFVIMDGIQGSCHGPVGVTGADLADVQQNMRLILAGKDAVAVDAIAALIMGYNPEGISHLVYLHNSSAGCADATYIRVIGVLPSDIKKKFEHDALIDRYAWYSDYLPPALKINSFNLQNDQLILNLTTDEETVKIEVAIDGKFLDEYVVSEFENISLFTGELSVGKHQVTVFASDIYLNTSSENVEIVTGIPDGAIDNIGSFELHQNYPNPFNPNTTISWSLAVANHVELSIYNALGKKVATLVSEQMNPGIYNRKFDGGNLASGVYYYQLEAGQYIDRKKMILLK